MAEQVVQVHLPRRHAAQQLVYEQRRRFNSLACGRRWGKTTLLLDLLIDDPGYGALDGFPCGWFAGTSKIFDEVWRLGVETLIDVTKRKDEKQHRLELITGGSVDFWSLDGGDAGGAGRGRKYRRIAVDEGALVRGLGKIWRTAIRPTLIDLRGDAWFLSTTRGPINDFHDLWQRGNPASKKREKAWASWQMPTHANPHLSAEELADLKTEYAGRPLDYRQEILAEFVSDVGEIFKQEWIRQEVAPRLTYNYQAWDLAVSENSGDWSVGVNGGYDAVGRFWQNDLVRGRWNTDQLATQIIDFAHKHRAQRLFMEGGVIFKGLEPWLVNRMRDTGKQFRYEAINPGSKNKVARGSTFVGIAANGSFYVPANALWLPDYVQEIVSFTGEEGRPDDQWDATSLLTSQVNQIRVSQPEADPAKATDTAVRWDDNDPDATTRRRRRS